MEPSLGKDTKGIFTGIVTTGIKNVLKRNGSKNMISRARSSPFFLVYGLNNQAFLNGYERLSRRATRIPRMFILQL